MQREPVELPAYRALLVVDMRKFSAEPGRDHAEITELIPNILQRSFRRCGLDEFWDDPLFYGTTGDGYFVGNRSQLLPYLLNPFLPTLQAELAERNANSQRTIRMRASVNVGPMTGSRGETLSEGSGDSRIENHRLLDSPAVRDLLERSGPSTCVGAIISERAFQDAVVQAYSGEDPDVYVKVRAKTKEREAWAYVRVPHPTGDLLRQGFVREEEVEDDPEGEDGEDRTAGDGSSPHYVVTHNTSIQTGERSVAPSGDIHTSSINMGDSVRGEQ